MIDAISTQAQLPGDNALVLLPEAHYQIGDVVKLQGEAGNVGSVPTSDTARLLGSQAMPFDDSKQAALDAAIRQIEEHFAPLPRPKIPAKRVPHVVRRGARRDAPDLPWGATPSLYMMQCTTCGLVKVGLSGDYRLRRVELEKSTGHTLTVLGFDYGTFEIESWAHAILSRWRVEGEWYRPSEEVLEYAGNLRYGPDGKRK